MHPRSVFNKEPDFSILAEHYDSFKPFISKGKNGRAHIDFKDPEAVKELTICLMKEYFDISIDFPLDSLCPTVPNRLNYILWLQDLIEETTPFTDIIGIDIGVGASCIYPLLGCATNSSWKFIGTDIEPRSIKYATENVNRNGLQDRITIISNPDPNKIFVLDDSIEYTFSMCNPPFYSSEEEIEQGLLNKELEPSAVCLGSMNEMITEGGELGFVSRMIKESVLHGRKVRWYTTLLGLKKTIRPLIRLLKENDISNYIVTNFTQGNTTRWAIAWSFFESRPTTAKVLESWLPKFSFEIELPKDMQQVNVFIKEILDDLDIEYTLDLADDEITLDCSVGTNTWSRAARRQRKRQKLEQPHTQDPFKFQLELSQGRESISYLQIVWNQGGDRAMFEGFWSHLKKRVEEKCGLYRGTSFKQ
ncbi:hypothetical protein INT48_003422 [Thamnidium elegans]|uniref:U6 small nuclear RNA (adenine-(43)-N(6))-methyltransferase n=1 Tax=Thamnidium elegans TaxID=101142 RepID=A0A8H7SPU7_9FUNG|nr:hypothetical protein INT48_003422 [Thamnidium elegans]